MKSIYKVPGGKLIKIQLELADDLIASIQIFGDFFLHPEDTLEIIEHALIGARLEENIFSDIIENVLEQSKATLIGASPQDIAHAIHLALNSE